eukprot:760607-Hanusia_phi.AAC.1
MLSHRESEPARTFSGPAILCVGFLVETVRVPAEGSHPGCASENRLRAAHEGLAGSLRDILVDREEVEGKEDIASESEV